RRPRRDSASTRIARTCAAKSSATETSRRSMKEPLGASPGALSFVWPHTLHHRPIGQAARPLRQLRGAPCPLDNRADGLGASGTRASAPLTRAEHAGRRGDFFGALLWGDLDAPNLRVVVQERALLDGGAGCRRGARDGHVLAALPIFDAVE